MAASHAAAPPIPGTAPRPAVDEIPPDALQPESGAEEPPARRRRKLLLLFLLAGLLGGLLLLAIWYFLFRQAIPLPGIPETQLPTFSYSIYGSDRPLGIAVSATGDRIYVVDTDGERVTRIFDGDGNPLGTMRPPGSTSASHVPTYVAIDPIAGEVYVSDRLAGAVYIFGRDGTYLREFRPPSTASGWQPLGLAFDRQGLLYVSDLSNPFQRVVVFDRDGNQVRVLGEGRQLSFPNGVAVDDAGYVYVADSNNGRLLVFGQDGELAAQIGRGIGEGNLGLPRGIAIDGKGRVFVVDSSGQGLFVYRAIAEGEQRPPYLGFFGGQGIENGQFRFPNAVAVDERGRVYVTDSANDRVHVWRY